MRKATLIALALVAGASFCTTDAAKKKKTAAEPQPVAETITLANSSDSVSYTGGMFLTNGLLPYLQQQEVDTAYMADFVRGFLEAAKGGITPQQRAYMVGIDIARQLNSRMLPSIVKAFEGSKDSITANIFYQGFADALLSDSTHFTQQAAETYFKERQQAAEKAKIEALSSAGRAYLEENAKKEGVITLPSGLQYKVLVKGDGEVPQATDQVRVNYEGRLIDGTVFDSSYKRGEPTTFRANQVIKGWTEALTMMPVGSKWQIYIPYQLGYGEHGSYDKIPPYSTLIFDIELVGIVKE